MVSILWASDSHIEGILAVITGEQTPCSAVLGGGCFPRKCSAGVGPNPGACACVAVAKTVGIVEKCLVATETGVHAPAGQISESYPPYLGQPRQGKLSGPPVLPQPPLWHSGFERPIPLSVCRVRELTGTPINNQFPNRAGLIRAPLPGQKQTLCLLKISNIVALGLPRNHHHTRVLRLYGSGPRFQILSLAVHLLIVSLTQR